MVESFRGPIAIVGIGCRFPGNSFSADQFWSFLNAQGDGISEIPSDRWGIDGFYDPDPIAMARSRTKWGGFLESVRSFDAEFFDISPREANSMDPQQRIALEVVYEAIQDAKLRIKDLQKDKTGVFVGVSVSDYGGLQRVRRTTNEIYAGTGSALSIVANRISHRFNFNGPSYAVDTACSSSLVAVDQACMNLLHGACDTALVCGVNIFADPAAFVAFSKAGMLSPTGTISTFDAQADGYVRGEGCGVVVLKNLEKAEREGDHIYAVIRATGINQDGQTSTLTAPNPKQQMALLRKLCRSADVDPSTIDYIEAHGTGTPVGDPIEARAIGAVFGDPMANEPTLIGSVKPNIGHLESAAGISGLIKSVLAVHKSQVPPNKNFRSPNPRIPFDTLGIAVPVEATPIGNGTCRAVVNSFGFGGTNASALVERYDPIRVRPARKGKKAKQKSREHIRPVPLSAASPYSLRALAERLSQAVSSEATFGHRALREIAANLAEQRDDFKYRAVCLALPSTLNEQLRQIAEDQVPEPEPRSLPFIVEGKADRRPKIAFTFAGQGGQWWAMARGLLKQEPIFAATVKRFDKIFKSISGWSVISELKRSESKSRVHDSEITQPAIFAVQIGLAAIWDKAGIKPDYVVGHSFGEVAAAYVAGAFSLETAARLIHRRGQIASVLGESGAMLAISLSADQVEEYIPASSTIDIAAFNGPTMVTVSGEAEDIDYLEHRLQTERPEVLVRRLAMNIAWHSRGLDPAEEWFKKGVGEIDWQVPNIPFISTVTGGMETCLDTAYWWSNLRQPVSYERAVNVVLTLGARFFLELGPHRTLSGLSVTIAASRNIQLGTTNCLLQNVDDFHALGVAAATLYTHGIDLDWTAFSGRPGEILDLPTYEWDRSDYWSESEETHRLLNLPRSHPLLGVRDHGPHPMWESEVNLTALSYLADHAVTGDVIYPGAAYMDMMFAAGLAHFGDTPIELQDFLISEALFIAQDDEVLLKTVFDPDSGRIRIFSHLRDSSQDWIERATARMIRPDIALPEKLNGFVQGDGEQLEKDDFYALTRLHGFQYGRHFQGVEVAHVSGANVQAEILSTPEVEEKAHRHTAHPATLDACIQAAIPLADLAAGASLQVSDDTCDEDDYPLYLPVGADRVRYFAPLSSKVDVRISGGGANEKDSLADYRLADADGRVCIEIDGFRMKRMAADQNTSADGGAKARFYDETFVCVPLPVPDREAGDWLILSNGDEAGHIATAISDGGGRTRVVSLTDEERSDCAHLRGLVAAWSNSSSSPQGIVVAWPLEMPELNSDSDVQVLQAEIERITLAWIALSQALDELRETGPHPDVWILTRGARSVGNGDALSVAGLAQSSITGLTRTMGAECVEYHFCHLDLESASATELTEAAAFMLAGTEETELVMRGGEVLVPRLEWAEHESLPRKPVMLDPGEGRENYQVSMQTPGSLDDLQLHEVESVLPGVGDVQVQVGAVGLNFRDIMAATGLLPEQAEKEPAYRNLGLEFGGTVTAVGSDVTSLVPGDRVMGIGRRCLQAYINQPADSLSKIPDALTFEQAATIPSAFATAHYALNHIARLRAGERVLIHAATGGVGLAAIQLAKRAGAEIIATVGSEHKRAHLKGLGISHILNSRSLDFADRVREITDGAGVDVVLNSLPGDFITKGLEILAPYGRFLEIGKRDVYADSLVGLKALRRNISLSVIDLASMGDERPHLLRQLVDEIVDMLDAGEVVPLTITAYPVTQVSEAFRFMSQAKHIGKVVVTLPEHPVPALRAQNKHLSLSNEKSYLVTGGSRGFGITVARWMGERGAGKIVLASRSGRPDDPDSEDLAALETMGVDVEHVALDITNEGDVAREIERLAQDSKPLAGIVHGAAVIVDGFLAQMEAETVTSVLRPKTMGAWNLHRALVAADVDLEFFVSFSSMAQVLGSTGQSNYVAANSFLEGFAHYRSAENRPAQTIHWGALAESGFVSRSDSMSNYLDSMGMTPITDADALWGLESCLDFDRTALAFGSVDWATIARTNPKAGTVPRFQTVIDAESSGGGRIRSDLSNSPKEQWAELIGKFLAEQIATVLKIDASTVEMDRALTELGFDSLSSIELKNRVERQLGISIPVSAFLQSPTLVGLCETIIVGIEDDTRKQQNSSGGSADAGEAAGSAKNNMGRVFANHEQSALLRASTGPLATEMGRMALQQSVVFKAGAQVSPKRIKSAWRSLVARHPLLKTAFLPEDSTANRELVFGNAPVWEEVASVKKAIDRPLDLHADELVRVRYAKTSKGIEIGIVVHKSIADPHSFETVVREFICLLNGEKLSRKPAIDDLLEVIRLGRFDEERSDALAAWAHWETILGEPAPVRLVGRRRSLISPSWGVDRGRAASVDFEMSWLGHESRIEATLLAGAIRGLRRLIGDQAAFTIERIKHLAVPEVSNAVGPLTTSVPIIGRGKGRALAADISHQLELADRHVHLGTSFIEQMIAGALSTPEALRQFGFEYRNATRSPAPKSVSVAGRKARLQWEFGDNYSAHDLKFIVQHKTKSKLMIRLIYDRDVLDERVVERIARGMLKYCTSTKVVNSAKVPAVHRRRLAPTIQGASDEKPESEINGARGSSAGDAGTENPKRASDRQTTVPSAGVDLEAEVSRPSGQLFPVTPNQLSILSALSASDCTSTFRESLMLPQALIVDTKVDVKRLERALDQIITAFDGLRTRFEFTGVHWRSIVEPGPLSGLVVDDLGEVTNEELQRYALAFADSPYDVVNGPLFEVRLVRLGKKGDAILTRAHHLIIDGWSQIRVYETLLSAYFGTPPKRSEIMSAEAFFARMKYEQKNNAAAAERAYWKSVLQPWLPVTPYGRASKNIPLNDSGGWAFPKETLVAQVDGANFERLNRSLASSSVSMNSLILTAFAKTLAQQSGSDSIYVSSLFPRRSDPALKDYVGYLVADVPLRADFSNGRSVHDVAQSLHKQAMASYAHTNLGFYVGDAFKGAAPAPHAHNRAVCSSLAPEHLMQSSPFASVGTGETAHAFSFGTTTARTLPLPQRTVITSEISLRPMTTAENLTLWLSCEMPSFSPEEAQGIVDGMFGLLDLERPETGYVRHRERFGSQEDWARVNEGKLPEAHPYEDGKRGRVARAVAAE